MTWAILATLVDSVHFNLVNGICTSSSVTDKNLATVGLDVGTNQDDNDPTRPLGGHARVPTAPFKAKH